VAYVSSEAATGIGSRTGSFVEAPGRILVVDDDRAIREGLSRVLVGEGYEVETAADAETALRRVPAFAPEIIITDLSLPGKDGLALISEIGELGVETTLIVLTGYGSIDTAVEATRRGAYDYLEKPVDRKRLTTVVRKGLERATLRREVLHLRREMVRAGRLQELVGHSAAMLEVYRLIEQVAPTGAPVLIVGESGTGKELAARTIHAMSPRASSRLVAINCAAIPETLLESEIFGHEKGAFTGATSSRAGCFELAHEGTLLLDEIGEMPIDLQTKLLRVLEDGIVRRVGGSTEFGVNVRVLAATNLPVEDLVVSGKLREDLYYRLNVFTLHLPPLRERREDIPLLAQHFLGRFVAESGKSVAGFSDEAMSRLVAHDWPGNGRELRNVVERAVILCRADEGEIQPHHLPRGVRGHRRPDGPVPSEGVTIPVGTSIDDAERRLILETLASCRGNRTRTARILGITAKTLYTKLRRYEEDANGARPEVP
jgi:DNA-binding NtrC family response regulator